MEDQFLAVQVVKFRVAAGGLDGKLAGFKPYVHLHVAVDGGNLDEIPEPLRYRQLYICGSQPPEEEEGGRRSISLAHGENAVLAKPQFQVFQVAVQHHLGLGVVVHPHVHVAVDLHVNAL